jgi:hypothetical protein
MRTSSAAALLLLASCGSADEIQDVPANVAALATGAERIGCALDRSADFARVCTLERAETAEGAILTVRQPHGGFHRLRMLKDGRGVEAADGAEPAKVSVIGEDVIEVALGAARYRLPARVGPLPKQ